MKEMKVGVTREMATEIKQRAEEQYTSVNGLINRWIALGLQRSEKANAKRAGEYPCRCTLHLVKK